MKSRESRITIKRKNEKRKNRRKEEQEKKTIFEPKTCCTNHFIVPLERATLLRWQEVSILKESLQLVLM